MRIMVMAGTSDATVAIKRLKSLQDDIYILATAVTSYGAEIARSAGADEVISKPLPLDDLIGIIEKHKIDVLVDSTHPFAAEATRNAIQASKETGITYLRLERPPTQLPENVLIHQVTSFPEAAHLAKTISNGRILHLAGVSTLHYLTEVVDADKIVARVLPNPYSVKKSLETGLPGENIIAMQGIFTPEFNKALIREYGAKLVVTKDSGEVGGTPSKIEAALELEIPVIVVLRPEISELDQEKVSSSVDDMIKEIVLRMD
ncbi:MAG TPA: precorrin-6A reductase [Methanobacteriaceae archaeon]|jgi:precorrin-6A/cobalt-precorrin-6A reductase|nr:precorrin-6A reductase [Methanobacteriaceae archaeon]HNS24620.1 precorrin-6A reductase [Methanobacteriaceae archaeon]